jgi:predicted RNase H-like HicB family nuclease
MNKYLLEKSVLNKKNKLGFVQNNIGGLMKVKEFDVVIEMDKKTMQYYASVPALPGCYSYADNIESLMDNIKEAIALHLGVLKSEKIKVNSASVVGMVKVAV